MNLQNKQETLLKMQHMRFFFGYFILIKFKMKPNKKE